MAELLILAQDSPVADGPAKWYAARIVTVQEDGHEWGAKEGPPKFFILKVPGISKADAEGYLNEWRHNVTYEILNWQNGQDQGRVRLTSDAIAVGGKGAITLAQVGNFFSNWNCVVQSATSNSVTFDVSIFLAATSEGFWGTNTSQLQFTETTYNQQNQSHLIELVSPAITDAQIQAVCRAHGVSYVAPRSFLVTRSEIRQKFQDEISERFRNTMVDRRRWYISQTGMDALTQAGGIMTVTPTQLVNNLVDGFTD